MFFPQGNQKSFTGQGRLFSILLLAGLTIAVPEPALALPAVIADHVYTRAEKDLGVPYDLGGRSRLGLDCSGFIWSVYHDLFPGMPGSVQKLVRFGSAVPLDQIRPGDILFFATGRSPREPTHVALYLGQGTLIHAVSEGWPTGIVLSDVSDPYWAARLLGARRPPFHRPQMIWEIPGKTYWVPYLQGWYRGSLSEGVPQGRGFFFFRNGDSYIGSFLGGKPNGRGVYHWRDGAWFQGHFVGGERQGPGVFKAPGEKVVRAVWVQDSVQKILEPLKKETSAAEKERLDKSLNAFLLPPVDAEALRPRTPPS